MSIEHPLLLIPLACCLLALAFLFWRLRTIITPFHFCFALFAVELVLAMHHLMIPDLYGRTLTAAFAPTTLFMIIGGIGSLTLATLFVRRPRQFLLKDYRVRLRYPRLPTIAVMLALPLVSLVISYRRLGTLPLLALGRALPGESVSYDDVYQGSITFIAWGAARALAIWLIVEMAVSRDSMSGFVRRNFVLVAATAIGLVLNGFDGQRNMVIIPFVLGAFALSLTGALKLRHYLTVGFLLGLYFLIVGEFRSSQDATVMIGVSTGTQGGDKAVAAFVTYTEPNLDNLNNLVRFHPRPTYGLVTLSRLVPGPLIRPFVEIPPSPVEVMNDNHLFSQPGFTVRTIYGDFYPDFGAIGSVLLCFVVYAGSIYFFNRASRSPRALLVYLLLATGITCIPFMNMIAGIQAVSPFALLHLLRIEYAPE
jgi:hypothetical protein